MENNLPNDFMQVSKEAQALGLSVVDSVLEPLLYCSISKDNGSLLIRLAGVRYIRGQEQILFAQSLNHNYVKNEDLIFPLPKDICMRVKRFFHANDANLFSIAAAIKLKQNLSQDIEVRFEPEVFEGASKSAESYSSAFKVSPLLKAKLYAYQTSGVGWLSSTLKSSKGLILADEMGLGKTIQVIATILELKPAYEEPILIICPTSLIANWISEIEKFAPSLSVTTHRGSNRAGIARGLRTSNVVLSTYDTVVIDQSLMMAINWSCIICDEAQALKNPDSNRRKAISEFKSKSRLLMTGTPVETSLLDMWSLLDIAIPGVLGSKSSFQANYVDDEDSANNLNTLISPLILRRTVAQVAQDLPERIDIECPIALGESLEQVYERIRVEALNEYGLAGGLVATTRLSVFCAHPALADNPIVDLDNENIPLAPGKKKIITPKMERAMLIINEASSAGKKILIFSNYNKMGELFEFACQDMPVRYWNSINGATPQEDRQSIIDQFSAIEGSAVLILNPKAAGAGLNITAATVVIHYTPVWNPALEMQASARAHRRGQTLPVTIYSLFYENTVEEVMTERARFRKNLGDIVVPVVANDDEDIRKALTISPKNLEKQNEI